MKSRSRPFHCTIADKSVNITLRHGGGLQEPGSVYVRCDERDCQYVDQNTAPCPLRIEMFADSSDGVVAQYLQSHAGARVCYACLTETLGITHDQVRRASWRLKDERGVSIRPSRCALCRHRRVTIGLMRDATLPPPAPAVSPPDPAAERSRSEADELAAFLRSQPGYAFCVHCLARELRWPASDAREIMGALESRDGFEIRTAQCVSCLLTKPVTRYREEPSEVEAPRRVIEFLLQSPGIAFCHACIAFSTDLALGEVRRIVQALHAVPEFEGKENDCGACGRWQPVVRLRPDDGVGAARAAGLGDVLSGSIRHRGWRVDLRSYRTSAGWRPFALVRSAAGTFVPDVPPILLDVVPTKAEADEVAAVSARDWIDKRLP